MVKYIIHQIILNILIHYSLIILSITYIRKEKISILKLI